MSTPMTKVLIAVDESEESQAVVAVAQALFGSTAELLAINVADSAADVPSPHGGAAGWGTVFPWTFPPVATGISADQPASAVARTPVDHATDVAGRAVGADGAGRVETLGDVGEPAEAVIDAASNHEVDVIVVGTHQKGWFRRLVEGSVSGDILKSSPIPVLVVPNPNRHDD